MVLIFIGYSYLSVTFLQEIDLMGTNIHRVLIFEWVLLIQEIDLMGTCIHRIFFTVMDGYLYS